MGVVLETSRGDKEERKDCGKLVTKNPGGKGMQKEKESITYFQAWQSPGGRRGQLNQPGST